MNSIVLTGGTSKRFGSDKSAALINGRTLLEILTEGLEDLIIVGPKTPIKARYVREEPIGAGPVAAIAAGVQAVNSELVAIFATDMPFASKIISELEVALINDAAIPVDKDGYAQPFAALYKVDALRRALDSFESLENRSMRDLIAKLNIDLIPVVESEALLDIDTKEDLIRAIDLASRFAP